MKIFKESFLRELKIDILLVEVLLVFNKFERVD